MKSKNSKYQSARRWYLMIILGPGIFFIVYLLIVINGTSKPQNHNVPLPSNYNKAGDLIKENSFKIQAGIESRNIFTKEMDISTNNHVVAGKSEKFFIIPVFINQSKLKGEINLLDSSGHSYNALNINKEYPAQIAGLENYEIPNNMNVYYRTYKVNKSSGYYFILKNKYGKNTWYFKSES
ncbi:MAG: hypothetical protein K9L17_04290 [Clostridiales bacterium]|nr:hypothetical protein [Clostridiales bacterium]MCF8021899.1 hypothetical protein [Clostridiales bacterium]